MAENGDICNNKSGIPQAPSGADARPYIPTLAVTSPANYGNIDAENESNLHILNGVEAPNGNRAVRSLHYPPLKDTRNPRKRPHSPEQKVMLETTESTQVAIPGSEPSHGANLLLKLPSELVDAILERLEPFELAHVSATCHFLRKHALSDVHWQRLVQENVPDTKLTSPEPMGSFRALYALYHQLWFLSKYRFWFCDSEHMGRLIVARFDPTKGGIEAYQLVVHCEEKSYFRWEADRSVVIHQFRATVGVHTARPILSFLPANRQNMSIAERSPGANAFFDEIPVVLEDRVDGIRNSLSLARRIDDQIAQEAFAAKYPYHNIWPPATIPARDYIQGYSFDLPLEGRPTCRADVSDQTFRLRRWMEMAGAVGVQMGQDISSYSTLDPKLYTPTETRPWRGLWAGDYSGHGFEFLLFHQPDEPDVSDEALDLVRTDEETDEEWEKRRLDARTFRGRLEAIKLTGDPNIPRGEHTFVTDDLGPGGLVGYSHDEAVLGNDPQGTRVVRSKGHVALTGFVDDKFIESQLMLISHDKVAQYWVEFGHISYFKRVPLDDLFGS